MTPRITLPWVLIVSLAVLTVFIASVPPHSEAAAVLPNADEMRDVVEERNVTEGVLDMLLLKGKSDGDYEKRNLILKEINDTAVSIEDLEHLLQVVRAKHASNRERRQRSPSGSRDRYRCSFYVTTPTLVRGYCYYDFGNLVTCKSGDRLSFEATECPRYRPGS